MSLFNYCCCRCYSYQFNGTPPIPPFFSFPSFPFSFKNKDSFFHFLKMLKVFFIPNNKKRLKRKKGERKRKQAETATTAEGTKRAIVVQNEFQRRYQAQNPEGSEEHTQRSRGNMLLHQMPDKRADALRQREEQSPYRQLHKRNAFRGFPLVIPIPVQWSHHYQVKNYSFILPTFTFTSFPLFIIH